MEPESERAPDRRVIAVMVLAMAAAAIRLIPLALLHPLQWDEVEFFRATDWIRQGLVPYRDFWEHHTPLQWFVFAPLTALTSSPGVDAVVLLRWAQIPFWIWTFWSLNRLMQRMDIGPFGRWAAMTTALCSSMFMIPAVEYRVDTLGCALYTAGLLLAVRMNERKLFAVFAGVAFCLAGFANLRLGPLLAITAALLLVTDLQQKRWRWNTRAYWLGVGVVATAFVVLTYFNATDSLDALYRHVWHENYLGDKLASPTVGGFIHRLLVPFGARILGPPPLFEAAAVDVGGILVLLLGVAGAMLAARNLRSVDLRLLMVILQLANLVFIARMKFVYNYHFEIVVLMMVPLMAMAYERMRDQRVVLALLIVAGLVNVFASIFRGKELDRAYQDTIMNDVHTRTRPGESVWDGVGWALRRTPAYRQWFLPDMVRRLEASGVLPPYGLREFLARPPAAVVADQNALVWLASHRDLARFVFTHYVPLWRNLWIPAPNGRVEPGRRLSWIIPRDGYYRIHASRSTAGHRWFVEPFFVASSFDENAKRFELELPPGTEPLLEWRVNQIPVPPGIEILLLPRGTRVDVVSRSDAPIGVFLVPTGERRLFRQPAPGVTLEGAGPRGTHRPQLFGS